MFLYQARFYINFDLISFTCGSDISLFVNVIIMPFRYLLYEKYFFMISLRYKIGFLYFKIKAEYYSNQIIKRTLLIITNNT